MAAALKLGVQKHIHNALGHIGANDASAHREHIGVVMLAAQLGGEGVTAQGTADAVDLVGRNGDADAGGADDDAVLTPAISHRLGGGFSKYRVITAL